MERGALQGQRQARQILETDFEHLELAMRGPRSEMHVAWHLVRRLLLKVVNVLSDTLRRNESGLNRNVTLQQAFDLH